MLPLGTMFYVPSAIFNKNTVYDENNIGIMTTNLSSVQVGITYPSGAYNFI
jgi:hypothetical protein